MVRLHTFTSARETEKVLKQGAPAERKRIVRRWVEGVTLNPESLEVDIRYRLPEPVMVNRVVAGAGFEPATYGL